MNFSSWSFKRTSFARNYKNLLTVLETFRMIGCIGCFRLLYIPSNQGSESRIGLDGPRAYFPGISNVQLEVVEVLVYCVVIVCVHTAHIKFALLLLLAGSAWHMAGKQALVCQHDVGRDGWRCVQLMLHSDPAFYSLLYSENEIFRANFEILFDFYKFRHVSFKFQYFSHLQKNTNYKRSIY